MFAAPALAGPDTITRTYLLGTGFLCGLGAGACPDVALAKNGDKIELTGAGTFRPHPKLVTGGGTFVHKNAAGAVIGSGTWTATELMGFHTFGTAAAGAATIEGGVLRIHVHITPASGGPGFDGILTVICLVGSPPPSAEEGIQLKIEGSLPNFTEIVSGLTVYIQ